MKNIIIFFGGVGSPTQFGGELSKNKEIISRLKELSCDLVVIDSFKSRENILKLMRIVIKFFFNLIIHPKAIVIFSTSFGNTYALLKILKYWPNKHRIINWVIGGVLSDRIANGEFSHKYVKVIDLFIVEGEKMKHKMAEAGFNNVIYKPNFKAVGVLPKIQKANDGKIHFLFISRILPDKGCCYILQSAEKLNQYGLNGKFIVDFYGNIDDDYRFEFENAISNMSNVNYCGSLQLQDERNYAKLAQYHYMLFPTYWYGEGFPGVVIDAYKAGVPIIGSDWNLNPEFIKNGVTGIVTPSHSVEKLTEAMQNAIDGKYDNMAMSNICQRQVMLYDTRNVINTELLDVIFNCETQKKS